MRLVPIHAPRAVPPVGAALGAIQRASRAPFSLSVALPCAAAAPLVMCAHPREERGPYNVFVMPPSVDFYV